MQLAIYNSFRESGNWESLIVFRCPFSCLRCVPAGAEALAQRELLLKALFGAVNVAVTIGDASFCALIVLYSFAWPGGIEVLWRCKLQNLWWGGCAPSVEKRYSTSRCLSHHKFSRIWMTWHKICWPSAQGRACKTSNPEARRIPCNNSQQARAVWHWLFE